MSLRLGRVSLRIDARPVARDVSVYLLRRQRGGMAAP